MRKIRLFLDALFDKDQPIQGLPQQYHYLIHVLRCRRGEIVHIFNGRQGEWQATLDPQKKAIFFIPLCCVVPQFFPSVCVSLIQGLIKRQELIIEKATELGISEIFPLKMDYSVVTNLKYPKAKQWAIEAAEQCERLSLPFIHEVQTLKDILVTWSKEKTILWAAERMEAMPFYDIAKTIKGDLAILIGPEGGISLMEQHYLKSHASVIPVSLGASILRAETAAITAIALAHAALNHKQ